MRAWERILPPIVAFVAGALLLEMAVRWSGVPSYLLPRPSAVLQTLVADESELLAALWTTTQEALIGFALSAVAGVLIAVLLSSARWVQRALYPYAVFFQTVPIIAIAPLLVIWFRFEMAVIVCAFIVSLFPMIANTLSGLLSTDPPLRDLFRLYGAGRLSEMWKLRLPSAAPNILTGLRIAGGLAVIGAIVGEFFAADVGLGSVVDEARTQQRTDKVFAAVLLASVLGLALFGLVSLMSWLVLRRWHASELN